jgi:DNA-binding transcriptional ArsR family regulator
MPGSRSPAAVMRARDGAVGGAALRRTGRRVLACKPQLAYCGDVHDVFDALGAPARRAILDVLSERDDQTLFEICGRLAVEHGVDLTRQAISQHLTVLEDAGLVRSHRDGRYKFHSIDTTPLRAAVARWLGEEEAP